MEKHNRTDEIENRLEEIEAERVRLLKELCDLRAKERAAIPSFALDERSYPQTARERVALFARLFVARKDLYPRHVGEFPNREKRVFPGL